MLLLFYHCNYLIYIFIYFFSLPWLYNTKKIIDDNQLAICPYLCSMPRQPNKCQWLTITINHWQPIYMSTCSKQKNPKQEIKQKAPETYWTTDDESTLITSLISTGSIPGSNYKPQVWSDAVSKMKNPPERGVPKTAQSCKSKWGRVCSDVDDSIYLWTFV